MTAHIYHNCERCGAKRNSNALYFAQSSPEVVGVYCKQCCDAIEKELKGEKEVFEPIESRFDILDL